MCQLIWLFGCVFHFKQKTAYEVRMSDWSSDVCSSDLRRFASTCAPGPGQPPLPTRLVAGLFILKHMHNLSDEVLCARWVENPYYQYFCGEAVFRHELPFDRSSLTRWRQRLGEKHSAARLQERSGRAHVCTPGTKQMIACRPLL